MSVDNINSTFEEIISGVPQGSWNYNTNYTTTVLYYSSMQGSIVGSILFNIFFNDFFYSILVASAHNFADDNSLWSFAKTIENLISVLESENEIAINWF